MKKEIKNLIGILAVMVLIIGIEIVMAHEDFNETKKLIDSNIDCDKLSNEQIEEIGDYLMEQMHPGEAHEAMHNMMGGEDSETTKLMHTNMAKMMYCNEGEGMNNMMNMMAESSGMMGMMNSGMMGGNMMGNSYYQNSFLGLQIFYYIILILIIVVLILVIILLINKLKKGVK